MYYCNYDKSTHRVKQFFSGLYPKNIVKPVVEVTIQDVNNYNKLQCTHVSISDAGKFKGFTIQKIDETAVEVYERNIELRKRAYNKESDPIYMEYLYDKTPSKNNEWRAKVLEIKKRYPIKAIA